MSAEERPSPELEQLVARYFEENERASAPAIEAFVERYPEHAQALATCSRGWS